MDKPNTVRKLLTGSLLKKTSEVCVKINHLFFQDVHPIPPTHHEIHTVQLIIVPQNPPFCQ
jgi:hypothetical protein